MRFGSDPSNLQSASDCLDVISQKSDMGMNFLYASVLEAQKSGNRQQVILALTRVCQKKASNPTPGLHLLALLRYVVWSPTVLYIANTRSLTARMLIQEAESQQSQNHELVEELCKVFEAGLNKYKSKPIPR